MPHSANGRRRAPRPTATSPFGVGRRENHDARGFYDRFTPPRVSASEALGSPDALDRLYCADASEMGKVPDDSVALVVTSPPYFAGKEYEAALGEGHVPGTYLDYLEMLTDVFGECVRTLEPGGRIAVNVANLGRKPYRSLSADVIAILQDRLGLLLRGEILWVKARGAGGSCAWGSFQSPANPVLRDLTERVVVASKGRFGRAVSRRRRQQRGLPALASVTRDEFMEATTDVWELPPESATRVGHPAPFPVELPQRLIELYTYVGDVVLDPFVGSGSTAVAAVRTGRHYLGYDIDEGYLAAATERLAAEAAARAGGDGHRGAVRLGLDGPVDVPADPVDAAVAAGAGATEVATAALDTAGFSQVRAGRRVGAGLTVDLTAVDGAGAEWWVDVVGGRTTGVTGLRRADQLWRALGRAAVLRQLPDSRPLLLLTTGLPGPNTAGDQALRAVRGAVFLDALDPTDPCARERLAAYAAGGHHDHPLGDLLPGV